MSQASASRDDLTRNQSLVLDTLERAHAPLTAYTILDQLREDGFRAPPQVYRALEKLVELGMVHRLESINAFVACSHPGCGAHSTVAFTICDNCGQAEELNNHALTHALEAIALDASFVLRKSTVELRGLCGPCNSRASHN